MKNVRVRFKVLSLASLLLLSGIFTFCGDNVTEESTHFVYSVNGISKNVQTITGLLQTEIRYDHKAQTLVLTASNDVSEAITVKVSNWDFQTPPEKGVLEKVYDATYDGEPGENHSPHVECLDLTGAHAGITICDGGLVTFMMDGKLYTSIFTGNEESTITITECDPDKLSVSGEISVKVQTAIGDKLKLSGTFTNVKYTVF
jgi:hypothetical protein